MNSRTLVLGIVLALGASSRAAVADEAEISAEMASYKAHQLALYDAVTADSSPRTQILAARFSFDKADLHLRPTAADITARATRFAPDDAFVQWLAADAGHYWSSQCGPTEYPEAAVASLVRLEPDNAGALQYAVALAQAKGDAKAVDDALARMAAAKRADDHRGDEIATWRAFYLAHPASENTTPDDDDAMPSRTPAQIALTRALSRTYSYSGTSSALESACKPDAQTDAPWQRLGHCVDAGVLLARKGTSFALRDEGLAMLTAAGATSDDLAELRRGNAWLKANAASFMINTSSIEDAPTDAEADWKDAPSDVEATRRRLARLGLPTTPPAGWAEPSDEASTEESHAVTAWKDYMQGLVDSLRDASDARERALGLGAVSITELFGADPAASTGRSAADRSTLIALAASHRDDALIHWIAIVTRATGTPPDAATLANLQRIDGDNAATWMLSLGDPSSDTNATLEHMRASHRFDDHYFELLPLWDRAIERHGIPDDAVEALSSTNPKGAQATLTKETIRATISAMSAAFESAATMPYASIEKACSDGARRDACAAIGRVMFDSGRTLMTVAIGDMLMRKSGGLDAERARRARQLAWWRQNTGVIMSDGAIAARYFSDSMASKSEISAIGEAMQRAGKLNPPADWQSPTEKAGGATLE